MKLIPFNINSCVRVKLTDHGRQILRDNHEALKAAVGGKLYDYTPPVEDTAGWSRWALWELMQSFGPHISMGGPLLFETDIRVEK